jgi:hypothetical protein
MAKGLPKETVDRVDLVSIVKKKTIYKKKRENEKLVCVKPIAAV